MKLEVKKLVVMIDTLLKDFAEAVRKAQSLRIPPKENREAVEEFNRILGRPMPKGYESMEADDS